MKAEKIKNEEKRRLAPKRRETKGMGGRLRGRQGARKLTNEEIREKKKKRSKNPKNWGLSQIENRKRCGSEKYDLPPRSGDQ